MSRKSQRAVGALLVAGVMCAAGSANAQLYTFSTVDGLSGEAEFTLVNPTTVGIRLKNTSTGVPVWFDNADQLMTGISWDSGAAGVVAGDPIITGGSVLIGPTSMSLNFSTGAYGPGTDVSGEYGYGNNDGSGAMYNMVSATTAGVTPFGGANLDDPISIDGPQAGLVAGPVLVPLGGLGAIQDEILITITLDQAIASLGVLTDRGVRVEFGSDAAFVDFPAPGTLALLGLAGCWRRRR